MSIEIDPACFFTYGLQKLLMGSTDWIGPMNENIDNAIDGYDYGTYINSFSNLIHTHPYWYLADQVPDIDMLPITEDVTADVVFTEAFGVCLADRTSSELMRITVTSGVISLEHTGEYSGQDHGKININQDNMGGAYEDIINGGIV